MIKGVPSTLLVHSRQPAERFLQKHKKNTLSRHENSKLDHPQAINAEMRQKSADPKKKSHKSKTIKPKKIRFVTEDIEKSTNNWLTIPSNAAAKSHKSPSKASSNEHHQEDAY